MGRVLDIIIYMVIDIGYDLISRWLEKRYGGGKKRGGKRKGRKKRKR